MHMCTCSTLVHTHPCTCAHTHTCVHTPRAHTHTHAPMHACTHAHSHTHAHVHTCTLARTHPRALTHPCTHAHVHSHTHTFLSLNHVAQTHCFACVGSESQRPGEESTATLLFRGRTSPRFGVFQGIVTLCVSRSVLIPSSASVCRMLSPQEHDPTHLVAISQGGGGATLDFR